LSAVRVTMISSGRGLTLLRRWLGIRQMVTRDRSADLTIRDQPPGCVGHWRITLATAQTNLALSEDGVYIRFVGYCNHVMRQVPVPQPSGPMRWCVGLVVVGGNRWLRQWADMKLGDIMRRVIIRSLAVTAVFTGLLFTGAGMAGANPAPPLNAPCYVLPTSCP
jgi:hypothetical protein